MRKSVQIRIRLFGNSLKRSSGHGERQKNRGTDRRHDVLLGIFSLSGSFGTLYPLGSEVSVFGYGIQLYTVFLIEALVLSVIALFFFKKSGGCYSLGKRVVLASSIIGTMGAVLNMCVQAGVFDAVVFWLSILLTVIGLFGKLSCLGAVLLEFVWGKASSLAGDIVFHEHRSPYGPFSFVCFDEASSYDNDSANRRVVLVSGSTSGSDSKAEKKQALGLEKMD